MIYIKLLIDLDEVTVKFLDKLCKLYSQQTKTELKPEQITEWKLNKYPEMVEIFKQPKFFSDLEPYPNAIKIITQLYDEGHQVFIVTDPMGDKNIVEGKLEWMWNYLPFLMPNNYIMTSQKYLLKGDLILDDSPHHIKSFDGIKVIMDKPYNQNIDGIRIYNNNWIQFCKLVQWFVSINSDNN